MNIDQIVSLHGSVVTSVLVCEEVARRKEAMLNNIALL